MKSGKWLVVSRMNVLFPYHLPLKTNHLNKLSEVGFEPTTFGLGNRRSILWATQTTRNFHSLIRLYFYHKLQNKHGGGGQLAIEEVVSG